jgi:hypothetical protein
MTNTTHQSGAYRLVCEQEVPAVPEVDIKKYLRIYFEEIQIFLASLRQRCGSALPYGVLEMLLMKCDDTLQPQKTPG